MSWIQPSGAVRISAILVLTSLLASGIVAALALPAEAKCGSVALQLKLDQTNLTARVESSDGMVTFTGQAHIDRLPVERAEVTLNATIDNGWMTEIRNSTLVLVSTAPCNFSVNVTVPRGTLSNVSGTLVLSGRLEAGGYRSTAEAKASVLVEPYFAVGLDASGRVLHIPLWSSRNIKLTLVNRGNANDSFSLAVSNQKELSGRGWTVRPAQASFDRLRPGENRTWNATITAGDGLDIPRSGIEQVNVTLTSKNSTRTNRTVAGSLIFPLSPELSLASYATVLELSRPRGSDSPATIMAAVLGAAVLLVLLGRWRRASR